MNNHFKIPTTTESFGTCLSQYIEYYIDRLTARNYTAGTIKGYRALRGGYEFRD